MLSRSKTGAFAVIAGLALLATGCAGGGGGQTSGGGPGGSIAIRGCEPENPLIPGDTGETCGGKVVDSLFTGLVEYNPDTAKPENAVAESIETEDNKKFTVKLKQGWKFHDGTEVKAHNFVDAWNYTANSANALAQGFWFEQFAGFEDVYTEDPDGEEGPKKAPKPAKDKLSGLEVVDDHTFTIELTAPFPVLPSKLGYTVFSPLPDSFFKDPEAFGKKPVGNGPFKFNSWTNHAKIVVDRNDQYGGAKKAKVKTIEFRMYKDDNSAYSDLISDNLDFTEQIPTSALTGDKWKSDLGERAIEGEQGVLQAISFPMYDERFQNKDLRHAISLAIDRKTITEKIFSGGRTPATGWVSPVVEGYKPGACGKWCNFNAAEANALMDKAIAAGWKSGDELPMYYNGDADHKPWTDALCAGLNQVLQGKVKCTPKPFPTFAEFRTEVDDRKMDGIFRSGWQMDFPHIENFLTPLYKTGAPSNDGEWSNKAFDAKVEEADQEQDPAASIAAYQEAEAMMAEEMPAVPCWYYGLQAGYSTKVTNVKVTPFGELDVYSIDTK
ncbi:MAG: ABC transporter substrate-binding protein [Streptosporangiales bacterium]|nr:ABC transporter substrate-binding protein [Streptosporangiales bacterium]